MNSAILLGVGILASVVCAQECEPDQHLCELSRVCIPSINVCDSYLDCIGGTEEIDCGQITTAPCSGHTCPNSRCIPFTYLCDGQNDCTDWSDESEEMCPCNGEQFRCPRLPGDKVPRKCIPWEYVCDEDGIWDCPDGADEANIC